MCENCLSIGICRCPGTDETINTCGCAEGVYCDKCGHYPKRSEEQINNPQDEES